MSNNDAIDSNQINIVLNGHNEAIKSIMKHIEKIDNETFYNALEDYNSYGFENYLNEKMDEYKELMNIDSRYESAINDKNTATSDYKDIISEYNAYEFENYLNEKMDEYKVLMNIDSRYESIIDKKFIKNIDYDAIKKIYKEYNDVDYYKDYNTYKQYMNIDPKYSYYLGNVARFMPRINYKPGSEYFKNRFSELTNNLNLPNFSKDNKADDDWRKGEDYKIEVNI